MVNDNSFEETEDKIKLNENMERAKMAEISKTSHVYTRAEDSYKDNMSTAYTFVFFGFLGTVFTILNIIGIFHILGGILQLSVSLILFIAFFIYGFILLLSRKDMLAKIELENTNKKLYTDWMNENFTDEVLRSLSDTSSIEELEILQINFITEKLIKNFPEIDPNFADSLVEEFIENKNSK